MPATATESPSLIKILKTVIDTNSFVACINFYRTPIIQFTRLFQWRWCAARTAPCLTAYPDERSEEGCAVGVRRCCQCAERTARYKSSLRHNLFSLMCGTLCAPLHPPAHYPRTTRRYAPRGTRLSKMWYASRTICPILSQLPKLKKLLIHKVSNV